MRKSKILARLRGGECARICVLGHFIPSFVRYAAHFGYDGIWLDLEHRPMADSDVRALLAACHYNDIDCMLRPPTAERTPLYRYLEDGATGFMFPFVSDAETARNVVRAVKFPPLGNRGLEGGGLDAGYGLDPSAVANTYTEDANRETFIVAQIETPEAVDNIEAIATVQGIDALFIGPADLGLRLSTATDRPALTLDAAVDRVSRAAREHQRSWGIVVNDLEELRRYGALGNQFAIWGGDYQLFEGLATCSKELAEVLSEYAPHLTRGCWIAPACN